MSGLSSTTQKAFGDSDIAFWHKCFSDLPSELVENAFARFVLTGDDWPSIAKIRHLALEQATGRHLSAGEAFKQISDAVRRFGSYNKQQAMNELDSTAVAAIEQCGGWNWFCELSSENRTTISAQFERRYNEIVKRAVETKCLPEPLRPKRIEYTGETKNLSQSMVLPDDAKSKDQQVEELAAKFGK